VRGPSQEAGYRPCAAAPKLAGSVAADYRRQLLTPQEGLLQGTRVAPLRGTRNFATKRAAMNLCHSLPGRANAVLGSLHDYVTSREKEIKARDSLIRPQARWPLFGLTR
jgi:hypothetical protein